MATTVLDKLKFLLLVNDQTIEPSLKTYADTLLFYYLGHLAVKNSGGKLFEIGVGGSTYPLIELSNNTERECYLNDMSIPRIDGYTMCQLLDNSSIKKITKNSEELESTDIPAMSYIHIDGDKEITKKDLKFALSRLAPMGIICQDDYGNNKHPMVTIAVHQMIEENEVKLLLVGDSSCWLVRSSDLPSWFDIINNDFEFSLLAMFLNIHTLNLDNVDYICSPFMWMNSLRPSKKFNQQLVTNFSYYFNFLFEHRAPTAYLKMPYADQSQIGLHVFKEKLINN